MDEKNNTKKSPEGEELNPEELETVTGAMFNIPVGGSPGGGTHAPVYDNSCKETTDTNMLGCSG